MAEQIVSKELGKKVGNRAERQEARLQKQAARAEKVASTGRPAHLVSLKTVEVKEGDGGFQIFVSGSEGRRSFAIKRNEVGQVLRDLETAIQVIRAQV
jgi:hypothetical protein